MDMVETTTDLSRIRILPFFEACPPSERKLEAKRLFRESTGRYDRQPVIDGDGWLLDGYATYLVMKENGEGPAGVLSCDGTSPALKAAGLDGEDRHYAVSMRLARKLRPGDIVLLFGKGLKPRLAAALSLDVMGRRNAVPAYGVVVKKGGTP